MPETQISLNGTSLHVSQAGSGPPLLLVHGFPLDHTMWRGQLDGLAGEFHLIAPDLRGFGKSDVTPGTVGMDQFADDLALLLDRLGVNQPVNLCGLSMGGYVAWQFWQRHRGRLGRLIVCDSRAAADSSDAAANRRQLADRVTREGAVIVADAMLPRLFADATANEHPDVADATYKVMQQTHPDAIAAALRGMAERPDMTGQLASIDVPTLLVCGQHDVISPPSEMRNIASAIPNATFIEIETAGHMAPLEAPAETNAAMRRFLLD